MAKYDPLQQHLAARVHLSQVRMTFAEVADVLGEPLPKSAFKYREWWANQSNTENRPQAAAWLTAGYAVAELRQQPRSGWVVFTRTSLNASQLAASPTIEISAAEGREMLRLHRTRERSRRLVARKKRSVMSECGRLVCEACDFDFVAFYGPRGEGFAECHHTHPISQSAPGRRTQLSELAVVCANCHRMLHRRPWVSVVELRELVQSRRG